MTRRAARLGDPAGCVLLVVGAAAILLAGGGVLGSSEAAAGWFALGGFLLCAGGAGLLRSPAGALVGAIFALYAGLSAALAAGAPAKNSVDMSSAYGVRAKPVLPYDAFHDTLLLAGAGGLICLVACVLVSRYPAGSPRIVRSSEPRLLQAANVLIAVGTLGLLGVLIRFGINAHRLGFNSRAIHSVWNGGAYLVFLVHFAVVGIALRFSIQLSRHEPLRRLAPTFGFLAVLLLATIPTGERGLVIEGGLAMVLVGLTQRRWVRRIVLPAALAGLVVLVVTQAVRDTVNQRQALTVSAVTARLAPSRWHTLLSNQFGSFQFASDVVAYGPGLHAGDPLLALVAKPVPRQLYPGKPQGFSDRFTRAVYPRAARQGLQFAVPLYAEIYYAAGTAGAVVALLLLGVLLGLGVRMARGWSRTLQPIAWFAFGWATFVIVRGDLSNSVPVAASWLIPTAFLFWWGRQPPATNRLVIDALAVPPTYSGIGETVRRIGESFKHSNGTTPANVIIRCPRDVRGLVEAAFPDGARIESPLPSSRPAWRRLLYQLVVAPLLDRASTAVVTVSELAPWWGRARRVVIVHDLRRSVAPQTASRRERRLYNSVIPRAVRNADAVIAVSQSTKQAVVGELHPAGEVRVAAVHSGIAIDARPPSAGNVVLVVSAIRPYKGVEVVIDALESLAPAHRPVVRWAGAIELPPDDAAALRERADRVGLELLGWLPEAELATALDAASFLLSASEFEGYDLSVLEGLRRGLIVIASDIPPHRELAGDAAIYLPAGDAAALSAVLGQVAAGEIDRERYRTASLQRARTLAGAEPSWARTILDCVS